MLVDFNHFCLCAFMKAAPGFKDHRCDYLGSQGVKLDDMDEQSVEVRHMWVLIGVLCICSPGDTDCKRVSELCVPFGVEYSRGVSLLHLYGETA